MQASNSRAKIARNDPLRWDGFEERLQRFLDRVWALFSIVGAGVLGYAGWAVEREPDWMYFAGGCIALVLLSLYFLKKCLKPPAWMKQKRGKRPSSGRRDAAQQSGSALSHSGVNGSGESESARSRRVNLPPQKQTPNFTVRPRPGDSDRDRRSH